MAYPKSVIRRAEQILGYGITSIAGERTYPVSYGTVYTDLFTDSDDIVIHGYTGTIVKSFNGKRNGVEYYNQIELHKTKLKEVTLDLDWGNNCFNKEIDALLEWLDDNSTGSLDDVGVSSKKIEDFSVSFRDASEKSADLNSSLVETFGFYIRRPLLIDVAKEQKDAARYF